LLAASDLKIIFEHDWRLQILIEREGKKWFARQPWIFICLFFTSIIKFRGIYFYAANNSMRKSALQFGIMIVLDAFPEMATAVRWVHHSC